MHKYQPDRINEPSTQLEGEMTDTDLEQVAGGFNPQPDPPAAVQKGLPNPLLKKVQKGLSHFSGDPIGA